jgi:hypothetical protein
MEIVLHILTRSEGRMYGPFNVKPSATCGNHWTSDVSNILITTKQKSIFTELYNLALSDVHQLHVPVDTL